MESLSSKVFEKSQILSDQQNQNLFGGHANGDTHQRSGPWVGHKDLWIDLDDTGMPSSGDRLIVFISQPPTPPPTQGSGVQLWDGNNGVADVVFE